MSTVSGTSGAGQSIITAMNAGSGVDIQNLATSIVDATKQAQQSALTTRKTAAEAKVSSVGKVLNAVATFKSALQDLGDATRLQRVSRSSDATKVAIDFPNGYPARSFSASVSVTSLATSASVALKGVSSTTGSLLGSDGLSRTLQFTDTATGVATSFSIDSTTTLTSLRDSINAVSGFSASIVKTNSGTPAEYTLAVKRDTGSAFNFTTSMTNSNGDAVSDGLLTGASATGTDAVIDIDGTTVTSSSNVFTDAIDGASLTVSALTGSSAVTVESVTDNDALTTAVTTLIAGFNLMVETVKTEGQYDRDASKRGGLSNSSIGNTLLGQLRRFTTQSVTGYDTETRTLADIGVKTNRDGKLSLDTTRFASVLKTNPEWIEAVMASKRDVSDSSISFSSTTTATVPGQYQLAKTGTSSWTLNGSAATLSGTALTGAAGTNVAGMVLKIPATLSASAATGTTYTVKYAKGMIERFTEMLTTVESSSSPLKAVSKNATTEIGKVEEEQVKLDDRMSKLRDRYIKQFATMDSIVNQGKRTQSSLTDFMTTWSASLKN